MAWANFIAGSIFGSLTPANLIGGLIFWSIGAVAFAYGKKMSLLPPMVLGISLIMFPLFVSNTRLLYAIGIVLTLLLYFWRE